MPRDEALRLLGVTQAQAKMWEFGIPEEDHISIRGEPATLFDYAIWALGDATASVNGDPVPELGYEDGRFSTQFLDAYRRSRLDSDLDEYTSLLAACAFRLFDMPGPAALLGSDLLGRDGYHLDALEELCARLVSPDFALDPAGFEGAYSAEAGRVSRALRSFEMRGRGAQDVLDACDELREQAYRHAAPRHLLLSDVACALSRRRVQDSVWTQLPAASGLPVEAWESSLRRRGSLKVLWPSQIALGEAGVYRGASAVVQMPTSAGKTRSIELVIRSAFMSGRADTAAVIAPFRALCHEIRRDLERALAPDDIEVKELPDVLQMEIASIEALEAERQVLVLTPEKLLVILRHAPELAERLGLVIYDEGHLFDDAHRGVSYELLLSSIKTALPSESQTLLVSAALPNVREIAGWLLGDAEAVVQSASLAPVRSVGYVSWLRRRAEVQFPEIAKVQPFAYFVPRVLSAVSLEAQAPFPAKDKPNEISLALALQLAKEGAVAVFCGRKDTAALIIRRSVELASAGLSLGGIAEHADSEEMARIADLLEANLGTSDEMATAARSGLLCHHASVPQGLRVAVEYAIRNGLARVVVCTSTLAQGVNLPIRYLVLTSFYQAGELMRTRDFVNLMGRAGRADKFTEGSVIFADPRVFDGQKRSDESWMWQQSADLIDQDYCEDCSSSLLAVVKPLVSDNGRHTLSVDPLELVEAYLEDDVAYLELPLQLPTKRTPGGFSRGGVMKQLESRLDAMRAVQSFLLANSQPLSTDPTQLDSLVESTLAWSLASDDERATLKTLFTLLWEDAVRKVPSPESRQAFGKTMLSATECARIESWLLDSLDTLDASEDPESLARQLWPLLAETTRHRAVAKSTRPDLVLECMLAWLAGKPFSALTSILGDARMQTGKRSYRYKTPDVVEMCQGAFGYQANLALGASVELLTQHEQEDIAERVAALQRQLKHGVPNETTYLLFEMGFSDRVICQDLASELEGVEATREAILEAIRDSYLHLSRTAADWPAAFRVRLEQMGAHQTDGPR